MRIYRILEDKYENKSIFYPQYQDSNCAKYIYGKDKNGEIKSGTYGYFSHWESPPNPFGHESRSVLVNDSYDNIIEARERIELDITDRIESSDVEYESIIHSYPF